MAANSNSLSDSSDQRALSSPPSTKSSEGQFFVPPNRQMLNSWKEIASYVGRGVRTVQRYERLYRLPVRRLAGMDHSAVMAFSDEIDAWLGKTPTRSLGYVRPVLVILDSGPAGVFSSRRGALESAHFNVLAALSIDEVLATADKFNVDGFVFDCAGEDANCSEICESLSSRFPTKPLFVLIPASQMNGKSPKGNYILPAGDPCALVNAALAAFGSPRVPPG